MENNGTILEGFCEKRAIDHIGKKYRRLDGDFANVTILPTNNNISRDGRSLLDDIEFFLAQPDFGKEIEEELFKVIQAFSIKYQCVQRWRGEENK